MKIVDHGVLHLLVTTCFLISAIHSKKIADSQNGDTASHSGTEKETTVQSAILRINEENDKKNATEVVKSQRRAHRFDSAASSPWVRVYNRPPGTETESFYNYETRGNTSAHTSGESWDAFRENLPEERTLPIERSDTKVKDILRVRSKSKDATQDDTSKDKSTTNAASTTKAIPSSTKAPSQVVNEAKTEDDKRKKGYIVWKSSDGGSNTGWTLDDAPISTEDKKSQPTIESMIPKDGSRWKVVGEGGEEGWQVVDDKGEVEWKIEYDDGEWRVTSTGDVPADAEWIDPEYAWGPTDGSVSEEDEYNSWPADDYGVPQGWTDPELYFSGLNNDSWTQKDDGNIVKNADTRQPPLSDWKTERSPPPANNENFQFGARRKSPQKDSPVTSSVEDRTDSASSEADADVSVSNEEPQNDQGVIGGKSWVPGSVAPNGGQKWVQGYGSKTWEADNTGWNAEVGGETWVAGNKNYDPWIPKGPGVKVIPPIPPPEGINSKNQGNSIRAWGTGYGSKTWKGNEWDSNVVWKTGYNGNLPWADDNSTWKFPETNEEKKTPPVWSQPIPSSEDGPAPTKKTARPPAKNSERISVKWQGRPTNRGETNRRSPPRRRTEGESWVDDISVGGVVWKQKTDGTPTSAALEPPKLSNQNDGWQSGGWKISTPTEASKSTGAPWKMNKSPKGSNLIGVTWNAGGDNRLDSVPAIWNQGQWADPSGVPAWIFGGCKMTLKCGSQPPDTADDSSGLTTLPDTSDDDSSMPPMPPTTPQPIVVKGWPPKSNGGKSWKSPPKSWRPPKWRQPTPAPTPETMPPTMQWKSPPPSMWKQPPSTVVWTETTPAPPSMSWNPPPPPPPPPMRWKKGPKPTKSWRPPPTKSWRPPKPPGKTWQPAIATPQPDTWPTTKPDCKDVTEVTQPPTTPKVEDTSEDMIEPPQIIIITKLPKGSYPIADDKTDKDSGKKKLPFGPWVFPPRKNVPKSSKSRKDQMVPVVNPPQGPPSRPTKNIPKPPNVIKGWPKGMPPPNFSWPYSNMRLSTTKRPQVVPPWKYAKYSKSKTWRQMFKRWMNGR